MFSELQDKLVAHLQSTRQADAGSPPAGTIVPKIVRPYGGELLKPSQLINAAPICYVEFDVADVRTATHGGSRAMGDANLDVICCARNRASGEAQHSDGVALLSWALTALTGYEDTLSDGTLVYWERIGVRRLLSGNRIWAAALTPDIQFE